MPTFPCTLSGSDSPNHLTCRSWLDGVVKGDARYGMASQILSGVIRITTHPKVFSMPSSLDEVLRFVTFSLRRLTERSFTRASGTGTFSNASAQKRTLVSTWCRTHGLQHWPSSPAGNGLSRITIMRGFQVLNGVCRHKVLS
jgi:hypothetical protein